MTFRVLGYILTLSELLLDQIINKYMSITKQSLVKQSYIDYCNSPVQALRINAPAPSLGLLLHGTGYVIHHHHYPTATTPPPPTNF